MTNYELAAAEEHIAELKARLENAEQDKEELRRIIADHQCEIGRLSQDYAKLEVESGRQIAALADEVRILKDALVNKAIQDAHKASTPSTSQLMGMLGEMVSTESERQQENWRNG